MSLWKLGPKSKQERKERQCFKQERVRIRGQERTTSHLLILRNCLKNDSAF